jgi:hypothetical protein
VEFRTNDCRGAVVYHEPKGVELPRGKEFVAWWRTGGPGRLLVYKADRRGNPYVAEEIIPKGAP